MHVPHLIGTAPLILAVRDSNPRKRDTEGQTKRAYQSVYEVERTCGEGAALSYTGDSVRIRRDVESWSGAETRA